MKEQTTPRPEIPGHITADGLCPLAEIQERRNRASTACGKPGGLVVDYHDVANALKRAPHASTTRRMSGVAQVMESVLGLEDGKKLYLHSVTAFAKTLSNRRRERLVLCHA